MEAVCPMNWLPVLQSQRYVQLQVELQLETDFRASLRVAVCRLPGSPNAQ